MWLRIGERTYSWHHQWEGHRVDNTRTPWVSTGRQAVWNQDCCYPHLFNMSHSLTELPSGYGALVPLNRNTSLSLVMTVSRNRVCYRSTRKAGSPANGFNHHNFSKVLQYVRNLNTFPLKQKKSALSFFFNWVIYHKFSRIKMEYSRELAAIDYFILRMSELPFLK